MTLCAGDANSALSLTEPELLIAQPNLPCLVRQQTCVFEWMKTGKFPGPPGLQLTGGDLDRVDGADQHADGQKVIAVLGELFKCLKVAFIGLLPIRDLL
jgi:hypothetical protein